MENFTQTEQQILHIIQTDFPLTGKPYDAIGKTIGKTEHEVIDILCSLKERNIIRQISAIFQATFLGFTSVLASFQVHEPHLEEAAAIINAHPGVSHNYQRAHRMNLWFTLSVPEEFDSRQHVHKLAELTPCVNYLYLPSIRMFKRRVQFDLNSDSKEQKTTTSNSEVLQKMSRKITLPLEIQCGIMRKLQQDLPLSSTPFKDIAEEFQIKEKTLFDFLTYLKISQKMSRFAAILKHRNLGFNANAMVVWAIPEATIEPFAQYASAHASISHCYERVTYGEWPYNMYTMLHSTSREGCQTIIRELVSQFAVDSYEVLYSIKEFKKQRIDYFGQEISEWHKQWME